MQPDVPKLASSTMYYVKGKSRYFYVDSRPDKRDKVSPRCTDARIPVRRITAH